jgi:hypothetical protein
MAGAYMKEDASDPGSIDDLNAVVLREEELLRVINDTGWAHEMGICSMMTGWVASKKLYDEAPHKAKAILSRLQALSVLIENDELRNWMLADGAGVAPKIAHKALLSAAAHHPLSIINGEITFEKESFLRKILELSEHEGSNIN